MKRVAFLVGVILLLSAPPAAVASDLVPPPIDENRSEYSTVQELGKSIGHGRFASPAYQQAHARADNPHYKPAEDAVSGHGWWDEPVNTQYARVQNTLYGWGWSGWWNVAQSAERILRPGGGAGNRTNARATCYGNERFWWKNETRVVALRNGGGWYTGPGYQERQVELACKPWE